MFHHKVTFHSPSALQTFTLRGRLVLPFRFIRETWKLLRMQFYVPNTDQVRDFLLFGKHKHAFYRVFPSVILLVIFQLQTYLVLSLIFKIWLTWSIHIFEEMLFKLLGCCWLPTFAVSTFWIKFSNFYWNSSS